MSGLHEGFLSGVETLKDAAVEPATLYERWWSGAGDESRLSNTPVTFHPEQRARPLFTDNGYHVHSIGVCAVALLPGEFVSAGEGMSLIKRVATWSTDHWNWKRGTHIRTYPVVDEVVRIYVPSNSLGLVSQFQQLAHRFDEAGLQYEMKYRRAGGVFSDSVVVWVDRKALLGALVHVEAVTSEAQWHSQPPPLALNWRGIGLCSHPRDDASAGWNFSQLLWTLVRAGLGHNLADELQSRGFDPVRPWRLNIQTDSFWDEELPC